MARRQGDLPDEAAARWGDREALTCKGRRYSSASLPPRSIVSPPEYLISSARITTDGRIVSPTAFAVLRLMTSPAATAAWKTVTPRTAA